MTPQEFAQLLTDLIARRIITRPEAATIMQQFLDGGFSPDDLPLAPAEAQALTPINEVAIFAFLLLSSGLSSLPSGRLRQSQRLSLRRRLRAGYEGEMEDIAQRVAEGGSIREAHQSMKDRTTRYHARQFSAGLGRLGGVREYIATVMAAQFAFMYRFLGEIAARRKIGRAYSLSNVQGRTKMYGGPGWEAWFRGNETPEDGYGMVAVYRTRDEGIRLCGPCSAAGRTKFFLPGEGVFPGQVCLGGGFCRCTRSMEYNLQAYLRLTGQTAATAERRQREPQRAA